MLLYLSFTQLPGKDCYWQDVVNSRTCSSGSLRAIVTRNAGQWLRGGGGFALAFREQQTAPASLVPLKTPRNRVGSEGNLIRLDIEVHLEM